MTMAEVVSIAETQVVTITGPESVSVITVGVQGPAGAPGAPGTDGADGDPGPPGPPGAPGSAPQAYAHTQSIPADTWVITHMLGYRPNVHIEDSLGRDVEGEITHTDINTVTLTFSALLSGSAWLS